MSEPTMSEQPKLPTRILEKPKKVCHNGTMVLQVVTDEGTFFAKDLAHLIGFERYHGWTQRLKAKGWRHPDILNPPAPKGFKISGEKCASAMSEEFGNEEWQALGDEVRDYNLRKRQ